MVETVLIVDDDPDIVESLSLLLEAAGYEVASADTAEATLTLARERRPILVLLDYNVPGVDVRELIVRIRTVTTAKLALCTAADAPAELAREAGVDLVLAKPFPVEELMRVVALAAGHPAPAVTP